MYKMQRNKNCKIKREKPESSSARFKDNEEHDLAYYIHDRVELMHQVFSVIKPKELKTMAPECVQYISIDDLQELCTEELLGISSKRLCAILDGAEPPSDTESSGSELLETISLDSISSDDEILSQPCSKNKKHKHKKHKSKAKHKRKNSDSNEKDKGEVEDRSKASRAGLTVLELLELQARARAIRAQLQQDNINMLTEPVIHTEKNDSSDEVEIKEEPPEVVEISSEDEKPNIEDIIVKPLGEEENVKSVSEGSSESLATVKKINNLIITVPQSKPSRKIKLKRNNMVSSLINTDTIVSEKEKNDAYICNKTTVSDDPGKTLDMQKSNEGKPNSEKSKSQTKQRKKQKKKFKTVEKDGSDHDEITLQLSDTEKMDLLEDFNTKDYDNFTSSSAKDSESSSENESVDIPKQSINNKDKFTAAMKKTEETPIVRSEIIQDAKISDPIINEKLDHSKVEKRPLQSDNNVENCQNLELMSSQNKNLDISNENVDIPANQENIEINCNKDKNQSDATLHKINNNGNEDTLIIEENVKQNVNLIECNIQEKDNEEQTEEGEIVSNVKINKDLSEGELSDKNSSEMNPCDTSTEIVCISDEENKITKNANNKKKEKKKMKEKKSKSSRQEFRENNDQNFFEDNVCTKSNKLNIDKQCSEEKFYNHSDNIITIYDDDNEILEILELSDDSCDSDAESISVLSKEPTAAEIAALSAKIDEIHNDDIVTNKKQTLETVGGDHEPENISWRDRYLGSKKVKKVLTTASILNALRKKNKELKTMLGVTKNNSEEINFQLCESNDFIEGSIEHFNTLQASTKYVNPITMDKIDESKKNKANGENQVVTKEMEKDAKLLLKMYKKLLKYNDMNKQKDPNKKKKKKQKKSKDMEKVKTSE